MVGDIRLLLLSDGLTDTELFLVEDIWSCFLHPLAAADTGSGLLCGTPCAPPQGGRRQDKRTADKNLFLLNPLTPEVSLVTLKHKIFNML